MLRMLHLWLLCLRAAVVWPASAATARLPVNSAMRESDACDLTNAYSFFRSYADPIGGEYVVACRKCADQGRSRSGAGVFTSAKSARQHASKHGKRKQTAPRTGSLPSSQPVLPTSETRASAPQAAAALFSADGNAPNKSRTLASGAGPSTHPPSSPPPESQASGSGLLVDKDLGLPNLEPGAAMAAGADRIMQRGVEHATIHASNDPDSEVDDDMYDSDPDPIQLPDPVLKAAADISDSESETDVAALSELAARPVATADATTPGQARSSEQPSDGPAAGAGQPVVIRAWSSSRRPRKSTAEWLFKRRHQPILLGADGEEMHKGTVLQSAFDLVQLKKHGANNVVLDMAAALDELLLQGISARAGIAQVQVPRSLHMARAVLATPDAKEFEFGWCSVCSLRFPRDPKRASKSRADLLQETCKRCGEPMYTASRSGGLGVQYKRRGWDFEVENVIIWMHEKDGFLEALKKVHPLPFTDPGSLVGSVYMRELDRMCNGRLSRRSKPTSAGIYGIGADGGNIYKIRTASTTIIGLRRYDLDPSANATQLAWEILIVLEGPHEPHNLESILKPTIDFFVKHDPGCSGTSPFEFEYSPNGEHTIVKHWPVLAFMEGDLMMMYKLMLTLPHSATRACPRCSLRGSKIGGAMRLLYDDPITQQLPVNADKTRLPDIHAEDPYARIMDVPAGYSLCRPPIDRASPPASIKSSQRLGETENEVSLPWANKTELMYSAFELHARAAEQQKCWTDSVDKLVTPLADLPPAVRGRVWRRLVKQAEKSDSEKGIRGMPICSELSYFRYEHFFHFALAHLFLFGLVKDFWNVWDPMSLKKGKRKKGLEDNEFVLPSYIKRFIRWRASLICRTSQFRRRACDVLSDRGGWTMEEWMDFVESFAPFVLFKLPWKAEDRKVQLMFEAMWSELRHAVMVCMRNLPQHNTQSAAAAAKGHLEKYAVLAQKAFKGLALTTAKLHHAVWHVPIQLACQGPGVFYLEFWIERMIRYLKMYLAERARYMAEVTFVNDHLVFKSAQSARCQFPDECKTVSERRPESYASFPAHDMIDASYTKFEGVRTEAGLTSAESILMPRLLARVLAQSEDYYRSRGWVPVSADVISAMQRAKSVVFDKYMQASLPGLDRVTCEQDTNHPVTDNRWVSVVYEVSEGVFEPCVGLISFFVRVRAGEGSPAFFDPRPHIKLDDGDSASKSEFIVTEAPNSTNQVEAAPLKLAVCQVWFSEFPEGTIGCSEYIPSKLDQAPALLRVKGLAAANGDLQTAASHAARKGTYYGYHAVDLAEIQTQLCPSQEVIENNRPVRYFMTSSKVSGR